jgi:hypothetical protein
MNSLPEYIKGGMARFDFRVPDGLGDYVYPDWDAPDLKVEFVDSGGTTRLTVTTSSTPPLQKGDDYDETARPHGGPFVAVENIDTSSFDLGSVQARIYAKVEGGEVLPCPTIMTAFEIITAVAAGPLYTTLENVKKEVPGKWPTSITDDMVMRAIADSSRKIDAFLKICYETPFPDISDSTPPPAPVELITRKMAAYQCLEWMGMVNASFEESLNQRALSDLMRLVPSGGNTPMVRLDGYKGPIAAYQGTLLNSGDDSLSL